jgi:hypothetical protein
MIIRIMINPNYNNLETLKKIYPSLYRNIQYKKNNRHYKLINNLIIIFMIIICLALIYIYIFYDDYNIRLCLYH